MTSSHAKASEWVHKEIDYALALQASSLAELPDIRPIILMRMGVIGPLGQRVD
jgi:hypothetical protein